MVAPGKEVRKQDVLNEFIKRVKNPAYNSAVWWAGNSISDMNSGPLGPRDITEPNLNSNTDVEIIAQTITNSAKAYAKYTTVYRRVRSGFYITRWGDAGSANYYRSHYVRVARLNNSYQIGYAYSSGLILKGHELWANELWQFLNNLRNVASKAQTSAPIVDLRICHSSCHSNCHGSRGRR